VVYVKPKLKDCGWVMVSAIVTNAKKGELPITEQQPKGKLSTIDESNSNSIGVVQPQNNQSRKPRPLRERSPLEEELTAKGYTVIDSQWITPGY
jgi:hypothetical protein